MPATNETKTRRDNGEGTAPKQRKDGRWFRQITVEGKKKFIYGKTKAEGNQKFREFKNKIGEEKHFSFFHTTFYI